MLVQEVSRFLIWFSKLFFNATVILLNINWMISLFSLLTMIWTDFDTFWKMMEYDVCFTMKIRIMMRVPSFCLIMGMPVFRKQFDFQNFILISFIDWHANRHEEKRNETYNFLMTVIDACHACGDSFEG